MPTHIKKVIVLFFLFLFSFFGKFECYENQNESEFVPEATIVLLDGKTLKVPSFALYSNHELPKSYRPGTSNFELEGLIVSKDDCWQIIQIPNIHELEFTEDTKKDFLRADITLNSGEKITGKVPSHPRVTWMNGTTFRFRGKKVALGIEGNFGIDIRKVKSFIQNSDKPNYYLLKYLDGNTAAERNLRFSRYFSGLYPRAQRYSYKGNDFFRARVTDVVVELRMKDIHSLVFRKDKIKTKIKMKSGKEDEVKLIRVERVYGKLSSGEIYFKKLYKVNESILHSILFK